MTKELPKASNQRFLPDSRLPPAIYERGFGCALDPPPRRHRYAAADEDQGAMPGQPTQGSSAGRQGRRRGGTHPRQHAKPISAARAGAAHDPEAPAERLAWGRLPILSLVASLGLLAVSVSFSLATSGAAIGQTLFWIGLVLICAPVTLRLSSSDAGLMERVGLVIVMGVMLSLIHIVRSPQEFTGYDELLHLRSLNNILSTGRLFEANPLLPVSPLFPGLEAVTSGVVQVGGADTFSAAFLVLTTVRIVFSVGLFALYREAASSERVAGLAAAVYMLGPNFTFFDSSFAYESMALPLVPVLLLITARLAKRPDRSVRLWIAFVVIAAALVITHHITSYALAVMLSAWALIHLVRRGHDIYRGTAIDIAGLVVVGASLLWLLTVASIVLRYLGGPLTGAIGEAVHLITTGEGRTPFQSATGQVAAVWERFAGLGAAGLLCLGIPVGLVVITRRFRDNSLGLLLGLVAVAYPASLLARLTPTGSDSAGRSLAFIFIGLAFVIALGLVGLADAVAARRARPGGRLGAVAARVVQGRLASAWKAAFAGVATIVTLGGAVIGSAPATRFPGPYLVIADTRSVDNEITSASAWARSTLGTNQRLAADRIDRLIMGSYGEMNVVFQGSTGLETWQLFLSPDVGTAELATLRSGNIRYLVIDRRLSTGLPLIPFYYEEGEIYAGPHTTPISPAVLAKWDAIGLVDRIYDNGDIQIYDVGGLVSAQ
jgi:hypothetical protein